MNDDDEQGAPYLRGREKQEKQKREREFPKIMKFESFCLVKALADPPIQFPKEI